MGVEETLALAEADSPCAFVTVTVMLGGASLRTQAGATQVTWLVVAVSTEGFKVPALLFQTKRSALGSVLEAEMLNVMEPPAEADAAEVVIAPSTGGLGSVQISGLAPQKESFAVSKLMHPVAAAPISRAHTTTPSKPSGRGGDQTSRQRRGTRAFIFHLEWL